MASDLRPESIGSGARVAGALCSVVVDAHGVALSRGRRCELGFDEGCRLEHCSSEGDVNLIVVAVSVK